MSRVSGTMLSRLLSTCRHLLFPVPERLFVMRQWRRLTGGLQYWRQPVVTRWKWWIRASCAASGERVREENDSDAHVAPPEGLNKEMEISPCNIGHFAVAPPVRSVLCEIPNAVGSWLIAIKSLSPPFQIISHIILTFLSVVCHWLYDYRS